MKEDENKDEERKEAILFPCQPLNWLSVPKGIRLGLGWIYLVTFSCCFLIVPISCLIFALPIVWKTYPMTALTVLLMLLGSTRLPLREWIWVRTLGELWYEIFDVSTNMSYQQIQQFIDGEDKGIHFIIGIIVSPKKDYIASERLYYVT